MKVRVAVTREVVADEQQMQALIARFDRVLAAELIEDEHGRLFIEMTQEAE